MIEKRLTVSDPEFTYIDTPDGVKLAPTAHVVVRVEIVEDGVVIAREPKHRFAVDLPAADYSVMLSDVPGSGPVLSTEAIAVIDAAIQAKLQNFTIWTPQSPT